MPSLPLNADVSCPLRRDSRANEILELARASPPAGQWLVHLCSCLANTQDPLKPLSTQPTFCPPLSAPSDSWTQSHSFRACGCVLESPASQSFWLTFCCAINLPPGSSHFHGGPTSQLGRRLNSPLRGTGNL